tara:strand:- start:1295 stop:1966 length:672 start_codon:yes stop_codon:yes gene_type:complete
MHQQRNKKILIYLIILLTVGSINNISLNKINFSNISKIEILGLGYENKKSLLEKINNLKLKNIFFINEERIHKILYSNSLVEKYDIFKVYPSTLYINIKKTKFLARFNHNGVNYILGSNGKLSNYDYSDEKLPFIFGKPKIREFLKFKKIIDFSNFEYQKISNFYYFASGRWDIELDNNVLIKLPEKNVGQSLQLAYEFLNNDNLSEIKVIDARVKNQIILND